MTQQFYSVVWRHVCEDVVSVKAESPDDALRQAVNGLGELAASSPVQSLAYQVYDTAEAPCIVADGLGAVLIAERTAT